MASHKIVILQTQCTIQIQIHEESSNIEITSAVQYIYIDKRIEYNKIQYIQIENVNTMIKEPLIFLNRYEYDSHDRIICAAAFYFRDRKLQVKEVSHNQ